MRCIIDDSESSIYSHTNRPDAVFLAGVLIPENEKNTLVKIIENTKERYGLKGRPVKYNNGDTVKKYYFNKIKKPELFQVLIENQKEIKEEIIKKSSGIPYYIVVSWSMCSDDAQEYVNEKHQNISNSFLDILNTSVQCLPKYSNEQFEVLLDRFPKEQQPILEDQFAFWKEEKEVVLQGISLSYQYGVTLENPVLQFTDIVTGTFKDLIKNCIKGELNRSLNYTHLIPKLVGYPNRIAGVGLIGPPQQESIIVDKIEELLEHPGLFPMLE